MKYVSLILSLFCLSALPLLADTLPTVIKQYRPTYPKEAFKAKIPGEVLLEFIVDSNGDPRKIRVIKATNKDFAEAAVRSVYRWKFKPGTKDGRPVNCVVTMPLTFNVS